MFQSAVEQHEPQGEICSPQATESRAAEKITRKNIETYNMPKKFLLWTTSFNIKMGESHRGNWIYVFLLLMLQSLGGRGYHTKMEFQKYFFISILVIWKKFGLFRLKEILICFKYLVERVYLNLVYPDIEFHSGHILSLLFCLF